MKDRDKEGVYPYDNSAKPFFYDDKIIIISPKDVIVWDGGLIKAFRDPSLII
jgi:hypothetical protein